MSEHDEQAAIFRWAEIKKNEFPDLALLNGSLNGVLLTIGQAVKAKRGGMKRGFPDINLPVSRGGYHGLYIELKIGKNRPSKEQKEWLEALATAGNYTAVAWGANAAIELIEAYLKKGVIL